MLRTIAVSVASMLAAACTSPASGSGAGKAGSGTGSGSQALAPPAKPKPTNALQLVQQSAPPQTRVAPAELTVPGVELFALSEARPATDDEVLPPRLVGVVGGVGGKVVDGRELVRAVIEAKADRKTLAQVALGVAQDDGELLDAPRTAEQKRAKVGPPVVARNALGFWVWTTDVPRTLERGKLDLATGALEIAPLPVSHEVAINNAITTLGSVSVSRHVVAIRTLAAACDQPRPRQALLAALGNHPRAKSRAAIADEVHRCGAAAVDPLVSAMQHDRSPLVRREAATALGRIGDARARPALARAARGDDGDLAWTASNALKKIP
jgi:hypothetical protein